MEKDKQNDMLGEENEDIVTLCDADGNETDFLEIAGIAFEGSFYAILQPVKLFEGMGEDEAIVFRMTKGEEEGQDNFEVVLDERIINAVFEEYQRLYDESHDGCECEDCECEDCDCEDCDCEDCDCEDCKADKKEDDDDE